MKNEGMTTSMVESETRKIPSITFLIAAMGAIGVSLALTLSGRKQAGTFVGQWAPTLLIIGVYNKIAKTFSAPYDELQRQRHGDHPAPFRADGREAYADQPLPRS